MWRGLVLFVIVFLLVWCGVLVNENRKLRETVKVYEVVVDEYVKEITSCVKGYERMVEEYRDCKICVKTKGEKEGCL